MAPVQEIFKLALKQHPLSLALVAAGVKPSSHCLVKAPVDLIDQIGDEFEYQPVPDMPGVGFYVFPRWLSMQDKSDKEIQLMIFNDQALSEVVSMVNQNQSSFVVKSGEELRLTNIGFYKLARTKKNWSPEMKQDVTVVCGLSFGFPEQSTLKFGLEVLIGEMRENRQSYSVKGEQNIVFIGYPETKIESESIIKKWSDFKQTKQFKELINQLKKLRFKSSFS